MAELIGTSCWASCKCGISTAFAVWGNYFEYSRMDMPFVQVRNPYNRLKSYYRDKVLDETSDVGLLTHGPWDCPWQRPDRCACSPPLDPVRIDRTVSFEEFCETLFSIPHEKLERHLYPQALVNTRWPAGKWHSHSGFSTEEVDKGYLRLEGLLKTGIEKGKLISEIYKNQDLLIVKLENYFEDLEKACLRLGADFHLIKDIHENKWKNSTHRVKIEVDASDSLKEKIYNYYKIDFEEFGYSQT